MDLGVCKDHPAPQEDTETRETAVRPADQGARVVVALRATPACPDVRAHLE